MDGMWGGQESEEVHSRKQQPPRAYERLVNKISDVRWAGTDGPDLSTSVSEIQLWLFLFFVVVVVFNFILFLNFT